MAMQFTATYLAYFVFLAANFYAAGAAGLRLIRWREENAAARTVLAFASGMIFWMYFIFLLSAAQILRFGAVAAGLVAVFAAFALTHAGAARQWIATLRRRPAAGTAPPVGTSPPRFRGLRLALAGLVAVYLGHRFLAALAHAPAWDALTYHLLVPKLTIAHHGFRPIAFNVYSHWPMNAEQLFTLALTIKDYRLAALVHFGFGLLCLWLIRIMCREAGRPEMALFGVLWFVQNPAVGDEFSVAYIDVACAFFMLAAFWQIRRSLAEAAARRRHLLAAGVFAGALAGCKFNGFFGAACLAVVYVIERRREGRLAQIAGETLLYFAAPAVLLWAPWAVKSALETGNPVYPELFGWFGGIEWNAELTRRLHQWHWSIGMGRRWFDYLLLPFRVFLHSDVGFERFAGALGRHWAFFIPWALLASRRPVVRWGLATAGLYFVLWSATSQQTRFLAPALPLLSVACAVALGDWFARPGASRRWVEGVLLALSGVWLALSIGGLSSALGVWNGDYARQIAADPTPPLYRYVNENLPATARLLFLHTNRGFFCDREYIADSFFQASQIDELLLRGGGPAIDARLAAMGVTHVLDWPAAKAGSYSREFLNLLADPARFRLVRQDEGAKLYERL
jgi:hypothetical protein